MDLVLKMMDSAGGGPQTFRSGAFFSRFFIDFSSTFHRFSLGFPPIDVRLTLSVLSQIYVDARDRIKVILHQKQDHGLEYTHQKYHEFQLKIGGFCTQQTTMYRPTVVSRTCTATCPR